MVLCGNTFDRKSFFVLYTRIALGLDSVDIFFEKYFRVIVTAFVPSRLKKIL